MIALSIVKLNVTELGRMITHSDKWTKSREQNIYLIKVEHNAYLPATLHPGGTKPSCLVLLSDPHDPQQP